MMTALFVSMVSLAYADKDDQIDSIISAITDSRIANSNENSILSTPNSFVALDFSFHTAESWDEKDQPKNIITNCINGDSITGFEYNDITIETVAGSYFSEAVIYFSDSNLGDDGIQLTVGSGNETSGTAVFNSNGILDISDFGNDDVTSLADGQFFIQFYEKIDDSQDAIDARFTSGILKVWGKDLLVSSSCPFVAGAIVEPDLSVEYSLNQGSDGVSIGNHLSYEISINNTGGSEATNVIIENNFSSKLRLSEMSCDDGTVTEDIAMVDVQNIDQDSSLHCTIDAIVINYGEISNSVSVRSDNDSDTSNNSATIVINGAALVIPVNNYFALLLLVLGLMYFARKRVF
ncbi:MAG: hypothetical protein JKY19_05870 [Alcanivoracaceae bacterium]|nr:hypothetical protein [Alcanivoracaceae bacterium]